MHELFAGDCNIQTAFFIKCYKTKNPFLFLAKL